MEGSLQRLRWILKGRRQQRPALRNTLTSNSNQSQLFLTAMKAFMLTRHCDQKLYSRFIHAFKRDWPVNKRVCVRLHLTIHHICVNTLYPSFSSYRWYCVWLPQPCINCRRSPLTLHTPVCLCVCLCAWVYIFQTISGCRLRCEHSFIQPIKGCHFIPMETCLGL